MEDPPPEGDVEGGGEEPTVEEAPPAEEEAPPAEEEAPPVVEEEPPPAEEPEPEAATEPPAATPEDQDEVQVADHMPVESVMLSEQGDGGNVRRDSTVSDIPISQDSVLEQLKAADEEARNTMALMATMRKDIEEFQNKPHLTEEDTKILEEKQMELLKKLSEFEAITRKMQLLVGLSGASLTQFQPSEYEKEIAGEPDKEKGGPPKEAVGVELEKGIQICEDDFYARPEDMLPQLVVCGNAIQMPRILICETGDKPKPKPVKKPKCQAMAQRNLARQRKPPQPQTGQCSCAVQEQLRAKDNTISCLKKKMCALENEMERTRNQNCDLSAQLAQAKQKQCPPSETERALCVPQCVGNYPSQLSLEKDTCSPQCIANRPKEPESALCPMRCPPECSANSPLDSDKREKYSMNAVCLKSQLNIIELEVQKMRDDLKKAQKEQQTMDDRRDLLKCAAPKCMTTNTNAITPCSCTALPAPPPPSPYSGCVCVPQKR